MVPQTPNCNKNYLSVAKCDYKMYTLLDIFLNKTTKKIANKNLKLKQFKQTKLELWKSGQEINVPKLYPISLTTIGRFRYFCGIFILNKKWGGGFFL